MKELPINEVIWARRKELGLTQEQLCEGICEPATLSRIESGKQAPSYHRLKALLQRLDLPDDRYTARLNPNESELEDQKAEAKACTISYWDAANEAKPQRREEALNALAALEAVAVPDDNLTKQYIVGLKVTLGRADGPYTLEEKLEMLLNAIRLTIPRLDLDNITQFRYSKDELELVNAVAVAYAMAGESQKAIHIYRQLFDYVQNHNLNVTRYARDFGLIAYNYSRELMVDGSHSKAAEIAEMGRQICVKYGRYRDLAGILSVLANCYAHLGRREESRELYYQTYYLCKIVNREAGIAHLRNDARDTLGLELPQTNQP